MAEIEAFRAHRYDLGRVGKLSDVIAPPYDVIDPALQQALYDRSPFNVVRLILNKELPSDSPTDNRYTRAAQFLREWQQQGVIAQDSARSLYVYHQEFEVEGRRLTRKGFMARVRLEKFGEGRIFPHEETISGPKADRLKLFHATAMNLSQIFGLYPDSEGQVQAQLDQAVGRALPLEAIDHLGVVSKLWTVTDQHTISTVVGLMGPKPIFIADGHHRYETALKYREERQQADLAAFAKMREDAPVNFVLMMLVGMNDPGLVILPTHRLVQGVGDLRAEQLSRLLSEHFQMETIGTGPDAARNAWESIEADGSQELLGFGTVADGVWQTARFRSPELLAQLAGEHSTAWRELAVAVLHRVVLDQLLAGRTNNQSILQPSCQYVHLLREVTQAVAAKVCQLAVLVPAASMNQVEKIAGNLEKMPPKSTFFYPKLLSGLVFNSLK